MKRGRVAGVDFGLKRTGLALSDEAWILASPLALLEGYRNIPELAALIAKSLEGKRVDAVVVGRPIKLSGQVGTLEPQVVQLKEALEGLGYRVVLVDERLTTSEAERHLKSLSINRKKRTQLVDKAAAVIILQAFLDSSSF